MKIEIVNQQRIKKIDIGDLVKKLEKVLTLLSSKKATLGKKSISFLICDDKLIKSLNKKFFKKNTSTDVISFPLKDKLDPNYLGEVVVSLERAVILSKRYNNRWQKELLLYLVHGILHLLGYDDSSKKEKRLMREKEREILSKVSS